MKKGVLVGLLLVVLLVVPVLAQTYVATTTVTEDGTTGYNMLPVSVTVDNDGLADLNIMSSTGLDTRVMQSVTELPHMVVDDRVLFALPITQGYQYPLEYTFGNAVLASFPVVVGDGGYVTISDAAVLELGDDFEIEFEVWIDTAGSVNYLYNEGALAADWVEGYSDRNPTYSKESDHLKIVAYDWDLSEQGTYVTDSTVDLSNVNTLVIDWENTGEDNGANDSFLAVSTVKNDDFNTYDARMDKDRDFVRTSDELDVSDLTGSYYIRVHAVDGTSADNHAESNLRTYSVAAVGSYIVSKTSAFYICIEDTDLIAHIAGGVPKTLTASGISSAEYLVKVYADGSDFSMDIDGSTEDTVALAGASVPDNANDYILRSEYFNYYEHTVSSTLIVDYEPVTMVIGTTLLDKEGAAQNGVITFGSNPSNISTSLGALLPEESSTASVTAEDTQVSFVPDTGDTTWTAPGVEGENLPFYAFFKGLFTTYSDLGGADIPMPLFWKLVVMTLGWGFGTAVLITTRQVPFALIAYVAGFAVPAYYMGGLLDSWIPIVYGLGAVCLAALIYKWTSSSIA